MPGAAIIINIEAKGPGRRIALHGLDMTLACTLNTIIRCKVGEKVEWLKLGGVTSSDAKNFHLGRGCRPRVRGRKSPVGFRGEGSLGAETVCIHCLQNLTTVRNDKNLKISHNSPSDF